MNKFSQTWDFAPPTGSLRSEYFTEHSNLSIHHLPACTSYRFTSFHTRLKVKNLVYVLRKLVTKCFVVIKT
jgi:hypothetical protein